MNFVLRLSIYKDLFDLTLQGFLEFFPFLNLNLKRENLILLFKYNLITFIQVNYAVWRVFEWWVGSLSGWNPFSYHTVDCG